MLSTNLLLIGCFVAAVTTIIFALLSAAKSQEISILKNSANHLNRTIAELDHQAKLIIKSDMELKSYQEEVEDKITKLSFLKNLIVSARTVADKGDLYNLINEKTINDLGFKKGMILNFTTLAVPICIEFDTREAERIKTFFTYKKQLAASIPLLDGTDDTVKDLATALGTKEFLITPVHGQNVHAIFIVCSLLPHMEITVSEKAIFSLIGMYLGQCADNIQLLEESYLKAIELEKKVKERTHELAKSLQEKEAINKAKSDFISSVSHELRTPLTSVKGFSSLLVAEKFGVLPPEAKKRLFTIDNNVNKLVDMVNTLLDIARIESGKTEVKMAPFDIIKLAKDVGDFLTPQIQAKKLSFYVDETSQFTVFADKNLIERVFINLINNALKFTPEGGSITITCNANIQHIAVSVADTGCGMSPDDVQKLFQEFFRANNPTTRSVQGTGLGLSLVKRIIETHKEKIWVESEVGKGTVFHFTLRSADHAQ